jgi:translation initiation factor 1 (eIF-1/SUI1)
MNLVSMRAAVRAALGGDDTDYPDGEVDRAVVRAVAELSRYLPDEGVLDYTVDYVVEDETFNSGTLGTAVSLANSPIEPESETVETTDGATTYSRDADYTMDYANGEITCLAAGSIVASTDHYIGYNKSRVAIDLSSLTTLMQVVQVAYPAKDIPRELVGFAVWGDMLYIKTAVGSPGSQQKMKDGEHAWVYYYKDHTAPTVAANGSYPLYLDEVVIVGAEAYTLFTKAMEQQLLAIVDITAARTALAKVDTHVAGNTESAKAALDGIAAKLTAAETALAKVTTYVDKLDVDMTSAEAVHTDLVKRIEGSGSIVGADVQLQTGDDKINLVNIGADVAELYRRYAETELLIAREWGARRTDFIVEAARHLDSARAFADEAAGRLDEGNILSAEANQRNNIASAFISEAIQRLTAATQSLAISDRLRTEGAERRNEFLATVGDKAQLRTQTALVSPRQPA